LHFKLSENAIMNVHRIGAEHQPVIVIDHAIDNPDAHIAQATRLEFSPIGPFFPGIRAPTSVNYTNSLCNALQPLLADIFGIDSAQWNGENFYSLVTTPPARLSPIQRIPHHDGAEESLIAVLHYLAQPSQGGTAFFRHRNTGFESITQSRFQTYQQSLEGDAQKNGIPPARYTQDGAPYFERIDSFDGNFNRMLIYRGVSLHSGIINNDLQFSPDPKIGRLTINGFLEPV